MVVGCVGCGTRFVVPDNKVPESGVKVRCSKCQRTFYIKKEKVKKGGPSSVVIVDPSLIAEIQQAAQKTAPAEPAEPSFQIDPSLLDATQPVINPPKFMSQASQEEPASLASDVPLPEVAQSELTTRISRRELAAARASALPESEQTPVVGTKTREEETVVELEEVYLPVDWSKRFAALFLLILALGFAFFLLVLVRNEFVVPPIKEFWSVAINGPKKRTMPTVAPATTKQKEFEIRRTETEQRTTNQGKLVVVLRGELKNTSSQEHSYYYVKSALRGSKGEFVEVERPCGTNFPLERLETITSTSEADTLYQEAGNNNANVAVKPYGSVGCTVLFFDLPSWAQEFSVERFDVSRVDGKPVVP